MTKTHLIVVLLAILAVWGFLVIGLPNLVGRI